MTKPKMSNDELRLALDYSIHRGRFGGTGVAHDIYSILRGDGYINNVEST